MKEPTRLFSEGGNLARALGELRQKTPDTARLERMAHNLAEYGVDVQVEQIAVEGDRLVEVGDGQVHVFDVHDGTVKVQVHLKSSRNLAR